MKSLQSPFKTPRGEAEYMAAYETTMRRWPVPYESIELHSRFGRTHLVVSGPEGAPPLLLLHGYLCSLTMWSPNVADLAGHCRVYAVDEMGQVGKSVPDQPIATRTDCVEWLTSILDGLKIDRARLVGYSYGGWLTLNYAIAAPDRVDRIVLLSPAAAFLPLVRQFYVRGALSVLFPDIFWRWIILKENLEDPSNRELCADLGKQFRLGMKYLRGEYARKSVPPVAFSDDELRSVRVPTLLLIGKQEVLYDPVAAFARAKRLIPTLEGGLIPRASHDMPMNRHDVVDARILEFSKTATDRAGLPTREAAAALWSA